MATRTLQLNADADGLVDHQLRLGRVTVEGVSFEPGALGICDLMLGDGESNAFLALADVDGIAQARPSVLRQDSQGDDLAGAWVSPLLFSGILQIDVANAEPLASGQLTVTYRQ